ncbi:iron-containing alcohol dehydrogenase [Agrococcus sp. ARC_14]|nr:iron-containing alcohol dehydrogenase [Agrococcus sp. ARC_14]
MGDDALESAAADLSALGSRVLIVTDPGIVAAGILELVLDPLRMSGLPVATFTDVVGNPDVATVAAAFAALQADGADIVVAVGGGSSMDVAKSIALLATNGGEIGDYEGVDRFQHRPLPIIMIPTTVGSGSEVTKGAVITNHETNVKMVIVSDLLFATIAILDPRVVAKLPGRIAATTGMDALTHAIEAYVAKGANPVTDAINIGAIELIGASLVKASRGDAAALYDMLVASSMAGIGFHDAGLGAVHALANTLGAHYGVHHGTANALFLPYVMDYNISAAPARFARIARALGENTAGLSDAEAASLAAKAVHRLADETGVPRTLSELEIADDRLEDLARDALQQADLPGNPREATYDDLLALYRRAA